MADTTIDTSGRAVQQGMGDGRYSVWTSATDGYYFYLTSLLELVYRKTINSGATWGSEVSIATATNFMGGISIWYDKWTSGDTGTNIHIAFLRNLSDGIWYVSFNTLDDSLGTIRSVQNNSTAFGTTVFGTTISKARGGNLYIVYHDIAGGASLIGMERSTDGGTTWTARANPFSGEDATKDWGLLFPGNEADDQDMWLVWWDIDVDEISLKTYDDSADSFSETLISSGMNMVLTVAHQMAGAIRHSDNHLILAAHTEATASGDLKVFDINGSASITTKTNIFTATTVRFGTCLTLDQDSDDIYVGFGDGSLGTSTMQIFFVKSTDGGSAWGAETLVNESNTKHRGIYSDHGSSGHEYRFQPIFYDDSLNDSFTNVGSSIQLGDAGIEPTELSSLEVTYTPLLGGTAIDLQFDLRIEEWKEVISSNPIVLANPGFSNLAITVNKLNFLITIKGYFTVNHKAHPLTTAVVHGPDFIDLEEAIILWNKEAPTNKMKLKLNVEGTDRVYEGIIQRLVLVQSGGVEQQEFIMEFAVAWTRTVPAIREWNS